MSILLSFLPSTKTNPSFPLQEGCENHLLNIWIKNYVRGKRKPPMIRVHLLKRRRRGLKVDPKLGGQWKVKEKHLFTSSHFPPNKFYLNLQFFSFDLKVLLYHGSRPLLLHFFLFPRSINYDFASQCNKSSTPSLSIWFWLKILFLSSPWNYGVMHGHILRAPSRTSEWRTASRIISRFDPNITSSWWRTWTSRGACSFWSWTPSNLVLSYFFEFSHPGDLVANRPCFWWQTWNRMWRMLQN
jgi:hypothetical protein